MANSKFPGLNQKYVQEIEQRTATLPAGRKELMQQQMYSDFYAQQKREEEQQERLAMKNEIVKKELESNSGTDTGAKLQLKKGNLADAIRNFYKLTISQGDDDTLVSKFTNGIKNGNKMYIDYLNGDNNDIMIQTGLLGDTAKKLYNSPYNNLNKGNNGNNQNIPESAKTLIENKPGNSNAVMYSSSVFDDDEYSKYYLDNVEDDYKPFVEAAKSQGYSDGEIASIIDKRKTYEDFTNRGFGDKAEEVNVGVFQGFANFLGNAYNNLLGENPYVGIAPKLNMNDIQFADDLLGSTNNYGDLRAESGWTKTGEFGGDLLANTALMALLPGMGAETKLESLASSALKGGTSKLKTGWEITKNIGKRMLKGADEGAKFGALATVGEENPDLEDVGRNMVGGAGIGAFFGLGGAGINAYKYKNVLNTLFKEGDKEGTIKNLLEMYKKGVIPTSRGMKMSSQLQQYDEDAMGAVESIIKNKDALKYVDANGEETFGHLPRSLDEFSQAIKQTKQSIYDQYAAIAREAGETTNVDTKEIVNTLKKQLTNKEKTAGWDEGTKNRINKWINDLEELNNKMSIEGTQEKIQELNKKLEAFLKNPQTSEVNANAVDGLVLNGLKKSLDDAIDKAGLDSAEYFNLRKMYKQLKTIESDVNHRAVVYGRQHPQSLVDSMSDLQTIDAIADIFSNPIGGTVKLVKTKAFKKLAKDKNNSDKIVESMFKDADNTISKTDTLKTQTQIANERTQQQQYNIRKSRQQRLQEANARVQERERLKQAVLEKQKQQQQEYQNYLNLMEKLKKPENPGLGYNEGFNGEPTTTIKVTPGGTAVRQGQIAEKPTENINYTSPAKDLTQVRERVYKNIDNVMEKAKADGLEPGTAEYDKVVGEKLYNEFEDSFDDLLNEHMSNPDKHPNLIDPDELRYLVNNDQKLPAGVTHPIVKELADRQYKRVVADLMKSGKKNALVMGGGSGAGKGFVREHYKLAENGFKDGRPADIIVDKVSGVEEANELVKQGFDVQQYGVIPRAENVVLNISQRAFEKGRGLSIPKVGREAHLRFVDQFLNGRPNKGALSPIELYANSLNGDGKYTLKLLGLKDHLVEVPNGKGSTKFVPEEGGKGAVEIPMSEWRKALEDYEKEIGVELSNDKIEKVVKERFLDTGKIDKSRYKELVTGISGLLLLGLANLGAEKEEA